MIVLKFIFLLIILWVNGEDENQIVDGEPLIITVPYFVSILNAVRFDNISDCVGVGSIITEKWVLTGNFTGGDKNYSVLAGAINCYAFYGNYQLVDVIKIVHHPNQTLWKNDVTLMELKDELRFHSKILPINILPPVCQVNSAKNCFTVGWKVKSSYKSSKELRGVQQNIIDNDRCTTKVPRSLLDEEKFCTINQSTGTCLEGVFGQPLICFDLLYGFLSQPGDCVSVSNVWTKVSLFSTWIQQTTNSTM